MKRKAGKPESWKVYDKINKYLAFKYSTTYQNIIRIRSFYGEKNHKQSLEWLAAWGSRKACGAKTPELANEFESFVTFIESINEEQLKDISKYWVRFDPRLLV